MSIDIPPRKFIVDWCHLFSLCSGQQDVEHSGVTGPRLDPCNRMKNTKALW